MLAFDFFQISASVAEIFLRKVKVGARVKSRRWCKYGQRFGVRSEQRFRHVQRPHPRRSTALSSIVTTVASTVKSEFERQPDKRSNDKRLLRLSFWTSFIFGERVVLSVANVYVWRFPWGHGSGVVYFRLASSLPIVTRRRSVFDVRALSALGVFLLVFAETSLSVQSIHIQKSRNTSD